MYNNLIHCLGPYTIQDGSLTVSGISAGGAMATQFHVAFSKNVNGVGLFAGRMYTTKKINLQILSAVQALYIFNEDWR